MPHILHNGQLLPDSAGVPVQNRGFLFADGIFETIRVAYGQPLFLEDHHQRIREGLKAHRIHAPLGFTPASIRRTSAPCLMRRASQAVPGCASPSRAVEPGFYTPEDSALDIIMVASPLDTEAYVLNDTGWSTDIYPEMKCTPTHLSRFKNIASNLYVQSGIWARDKGLDTALIQNDRMGIIEGTSSNLFLVSNGVLYTPGIDSGATAGVLRAQVINLALTSGMKVYECNLTPQNLLVADEVFLTNAVQGIRWVGSYRTKRYFNGATSDLMTRLNAHVKASIQA